MTATAADLLTAAGHIRADLDDYTRPDSTDRRALTALVDLLTAAARNDDIGVNDAVNRFAAATITQRAEEATYQETKTAVNRAHQTRIEQPDRYTYRWVCTCGQRGTPLTIDVVAAGDGDKHRAEQLTAALTAA